MGYLARDCMFRTAVYDLDRTNQRLPDPNNPGFFILSGTTKTKGFEAEISGYITEAWQMVGGYAYTDARIASTHLDNDRRQAIASASCRTTSSLSGTSISSTQQWAAGVGIIHQTDFYASSDDTVPLPGFTRVDAALYGRFNQNFRWQINVENVFDRRYIATADGNNNITPGSPFAVRGTLIASY